MRSPESSSGQAKVRSLPASLLIIGHRKAKAVGLRTSNVKTMKILIIGGGQPHSLESYYEKALSAIGTTVEILPIYDIFYQYYTKNIFNKIKHRLHLSSIYKRLNQTILEKVATYRPDIVWVFKGMEVLPSTLKILRAKEIKLANFNPDHPFFFMGYSSGNKNVTDGLPYYDLHFCYDQKVASKITETYNIPTPILPFGYAVSDKLYRQLYHLPEILSVCFVGTYDKPRAKIIYQLAQAQVPIVVYGNGWHGKLNRFNHVQTNPPIYTEDYWKALRQYRVQLNILRLHNKANHNMRTFEIPSVGGIMLTEATDDHTSFFQKGQEFFIYRNAAI